MTTEEKLKLLSNAYIKLTDYSIMDSLDEDEYNELGIADALEIAEAVVVDDE